MQTDLNSKNSQSTKPIVMHDFDELQFKAIGEGLGFHQNQNEKSSWQHKPAREPTAQKPLNKIERSAFNEPRMEAASSISREQLGAIYNPKETAFPFQANENIAPKAHATMTTKSQKIATMPERLSAQLADVMIVSCGVAAMFVLMLLAAQVPLNQASALLRSWDVAPVVAVLWLFAYVAYFTILETHQTPGKKMMRLQVVEASGEALTLGRSLERTAFRMLSWLALGFPLLMDFHGRLSRTKVVRK